MTHRDGHFCPPMKWNAWGDPAAAKPLSDGIRALLQQALGVEADRRRRARRRPGPAAPVGVVARRPGRAWPPSSAPTTASPTTATGCCAPAASPLSTCCAARTAASRMHPTPCCCPATTTRSPRSCATAPSTASRSSRSAAAPASSAASIRSAATSSAVVSLDLRRLRRAALARRGVRRGRTRRRASPARRPRRLLGERGFSLGHFPQSFEFATIGGFAATRSSGQDSAGYGRFDDMVRGLRVVTPVGRARPGPRAGVGGGPRPAPAADRLGGRLRRHHPGAACACTRVPEATRYEAWSFPDFATGADALRAVVQTGTGPTVIRLSDEAETGVNLATTESDRRTARSPAAAWRSRRSRAPRTTSKAGTPRRAHCWQAQGGTSLGEAPARAWEHGRFDAPYLRDSLLVGGRAVRDAGDRDRLVERAHAQGRRHRSADRRTRRVRHAGAGAVPHLARLPDRRVAVLHRRRRAARQPDRAVARRQEPPRRTRWCAPAEPSPTTTPSVPTTGRGCATRSAISASGAARGQGDAGPGRNPQPRQADSVTTELAPPRSAR